MKILVHHGDRQLGPYSLEEVRAEMAKGVLLPGDLAWLEGTPEWVPLSTLPGLVTGAAPPMARANAPSSGFAIASLILGLLSFGCAFFTGIPAAICGVIALLQISKSKGGFKGEGMAIAGMVTGLVGMIFGTAVLASILIPVFSAATESAKANQSLMRAKKICTGCRMYASDHGGKYPNSLEELVPDYVQDKSDLSDPGQKDKAEIGYFYYGSAHFQSEAGNKVLLASKAVYRKKRAIARFDGSVRVEAAGDNDLTKFESP